MEPFPGSAPSDPAPQPPPASPAQAPAEPARRLPASTLAAALLSAAAGALAAWLLARAQPVPPLLVAPPPAVSARPVVALGNLDVAALYRQAAPAVVQVLRTGGRGVPSGQGSGFVVDGRGYILTNYHVVGDTGRVWVRADDGSQWEGRVLGRDPSNDLALVQVNPGARPLPALPLGDSDAVQPGDPVIAIGYPLGAKAVTAGIVSAKNRTSESPAGWPQVGLIQTDALLLPGNSGGPLLNAQGEAIGIAAQVTGPGGLGLAIPSNTARRLLPDLMAGRRIEHPWLGISGAPLTPDQAQALRLPVSRGVVVFEVLPGSPAAAAGLQPATRTAQGEVVPGDIIVAIDERPVGSVEDLVGYLSGRRPGDRVVLTVVRPGGAQRQVEVVLAPRPERAP